MNAGVNVAVGLGVRVVLGLAVGVGVALAVAVAEGVNVRVGVDVMAAAGVGARFRCQKTPLAKPSAINPTDRRAMVDKRRMAPILTAGLYPGKRTLVIADQASWVIDAGLRSSM